MSKEIIEGNKLICEFMGLVGWNEKGDPNEYGYYHSQWGMLMPVVEKIEQLPTSTWVKIYGDKKLGECEISDENCDHDSNGFWQPRASVQKISKIEAVWTCVIKFITWYNQQNT